MPAARPDATQDRLDGLVAWLRGLGLAPGIALPPERVLAGNLGCSRRQLRHALDELLHGGELVRDRRGALTAASRPGGRHLVLIADPSRSPSPEARQRGTIGLDQHSMLGVRDVAAEHGLTLALVPPDAEAATPARLAALAPVGVIIHEQAAPGLAASGRLRELCAGPLPVVVIADQLPSAVQRKLTVAQTGADHAAGAGLLLAWLAERGVRRVLRYELDAVDGVIPAWRQHRLDGHRRACRRLGLTDLPPVSPYRVPGMQFGVASAFADQVAIAAGYLQPHLWRSPRPDAIVALTDGLTFEIAAACRLYDLDPTTAPLVVGYDAYADLPGTRGPRMASGFLPPVSIDPRYREVGREAARLLLAGGGPRTSLVAPRLVELGGAGRD